MAEYDEAGIRAQYPQLAYLMNDPEIGDKLRQAYEGDWAPDKFQAEIMATNWWKNTSDTRRAYHLEMNTDPSTFLRKLEEQAKVTRRIAGELGYELDGGYIQSFSEKAMENGWDEATLRSVIVDEITPLVGATEKSPVLAAIREASSQWGIVFDTPTLNHWLRELGSGRQTVDNLNLAMQQQAIGFMPHLAGQFDAGQTLRQVAEPYKRILADTLEIEPQSIDMYGDPKWREVLAHADPAGGTRLMSLVEAAKYAREQGEWQYTQNFRDTADGAVRSLRGVFGS